MSSAPIEMTSQHASTSFEGGNASTSIPLGTPDNSFMLDIEKFIKYVHTQLSRCSCNWRKSLRIDRLFIVIAAVIISRICPGSHARRIQVLAYFSGFTLGCFLYMCRVSLHYALYYETNVHSTKQTFLHSMQYGRSLPTAGFEFGQQRKIPHILHQSWDTTSVPIEMVPWMDSWRKNHPHWKYTFWTKTTSEEFIEREFPLLYNQVYKNYTHALHRYMVNRYFILYQHGGVYADLGMENIRTLDLLIQNHSCVLTEQPLIHRAILLNETSPNYIVNSFIACEKGHPFVKFILTMLDTYYTMYDVKLEPDRERVEKSVGSLFLGDVYQLYKAATNASDVKVLPSELLLPNYNERHRYTLVRRCLGGPLSELGQQLCGDMKKSDFSNKIPPNAYCKSHWMDLLDPIVINRLLYSQTQNVADLYEFN